jgi:hypothetical protein
VGLIVAAIGLVAVGFVLSGGSAPVVPTPTTSADSPTTLTTMITTTAPSLPGVVGVGDAATFDPFGEGGENDQLLDALLDDDVATEWTTERYLDPLPLLKPGVGVTVRASGTPSSLQLVGLTEATDFEILWSNQLVEDLTLWDRVISATASPAGTTLDLPPRADGFWLIWLTDLPPRGDGSYQAAIAELRFAP